MCAEASASRSKRATISAFAVISDGKIFSARRFRINKCSTRYTLPIPPSPSFASKRYDLRRERCQCEGAADTFRATIFAGIAATSAPWRFRREGMASGAVLPRFSV